MARLKAADLRGLHEFLRESYAVLDLDAFLAHALRGIPKLVPCEFTAFNEYYPRKRRIRWVTDPPDFTTPGDQRMFEQQTHEQPLITYVRRTGDGGAMKISDFLGRSQFHRTGLYNELFRRHGIEYQTSFCLPTPPSLILAFTLQRTRRDFTEEERLILNLLRPHLIQGYWNAELVTQMREELSGLRESLEGLDLGVVLLGWDWRAVPLNARARQLLATYFGREPGPGGQLPDDLKRWIAHQDAVLGQKGGVPPPRTPLVVDRDGARLVLRLASGSARRLLILEERAARPDAAGLEPLGLTRREAEVLAWVTQGKTNAEIGAILGARPRTVEKHLERICQKLGVENRTAAAAHALAFAGSRR